MNTTTKSAMELQVGDTIITQVWSMSPDYFGKMRAVWQDAIAVIETVDAYLFRSSVGVDVTMKVEGIDEPVLESFSETDMIEVLN